jgi:translation initiation factor 6
LTVSKLSLQGSPNVGIYALATNRYILAPPKTSELKARLLEKTLNAPLVRSSFAGTILLGVYAAANSNGMVLPDIVGEEEMKAFSTTVGNVVQVESRRNALGNLILVNDHGALVAESLYREKEVVRAIRDTLGVEVAVGRIAGLPYVGSLASANNKVALVHPERSDEEAEFLASVLKVQVDSGTVNRGSPFVGAGMLCNDSGVVVGSLTAGPELMIISNLFENV